MLGRPTKYDDTVIDKTVEYLKAHQDSYVKTDDGRVKIKVNLPTIEGLASFIGVNKTTLYEWEKDHEDFSNALDTIRTEQQNRLINSGLSGDYNSTIAKLILSSNHGMREKSDVTTDGKQLPTPILNALPSNDSTQEDTATQETP